MASADQLKALLKSHIEGDEQRFYSVAMQIAANQAKQGHGKLAEELRALVDAAKKHSAASRLGEPIPISQPRGDLAGLLEVSYPKVRRSDIVLSESLARKIGRVIREQRHAARILEHGLHPRRKLLLVGPPGSGKTLTASVLAGELAIPLFQVRLDALITKYMGETAAKLRQIFDATDRARGIYFFDEFDAIGSQRGLTNDVGEIRRVLNSFLQMIEQDRSHSLILAATNHPEILDYALFRRFDDVLHYGLPSDEQIAALLEAKLGHAAQNGVPWLDLAKGAAGLSFAEVTRAADDLHKEALMNDAPTVGAKDICRVLEERREFAAQT